MIKNFSEQLYQMLPAIYRREDANIKPSKEPLRRYLNILGGGGFEVLLKSIEESRFIHDVDNIDSKYLPLIAQTLGFDFPYIIDENTQRKFLKIVPVLYKLKGTESSFNYLAREIFSTKSEITTTVPQYKEGISEEELRKIYLNIEVDGGISDIQGKEEFFRQFAEIIRPVNRELLIILKLIYYADYDLQSRARDTIFETLIDHQGVDRFRYRLLVDGVDHNITNSGIILGQNFKEFLNLNSGGTYGGQSIKEVIRLLEDTYVLDTIKLTPELEDFNFVGRVTDHLNNFYLNATLLGSKGAGVGFSHHWDFITSNDIDNYLKDISDLDSVKLNTPIDLDFLVKRRTYIDNVLSLELDSSLVLEVNGAQGFKLNKGKLYTGREVIRTEERFTDETVSWKLRDVIDTELVRKPYDFTDPIILNVTNLNRRVNGFIATKSQLTLVKPTTTLNKEMKLGNDFYLTHFTPPETNFNY